MIPLENFIANDFGRYDINRPSIHGSTRAKYSKTYNNNNIFTFDTETTSIIDGDNKYSFVYIAMISINGVVYYCRDLSVFKQFLDKYDTPGTINVIYVHNLGFDFTFLQNVLDFETVFARTAHKPIFARYKSWEFRCSYFLSQMSLANVGKYYDLPHAKMVDALKYKKRRHTDTELTDAEEDYAEKDCLVLHDYVQYMLNQCGGKYRDIPYTQTGFVRKYILQRSKDDREYFALRKIVKQTKPEIDLFQVFEKCYAGGYTHANFMAVASGLYQHVKSYDFCSSYPAVMVRCKFPMGKFREICTNYDHYLYSADYCCVGRFRLSNIKARSYLCYISGHKIVKGTCIKGKISNGRLYSADSCEIFLTNVDIQTIKMMYTDDLKIEVLQLWAATADYLPGTVVRSILQLYENKTRLKGVDSKKPLYLASKQMVNSVYGMSVFNPYCDEIVYNSGVWDVDRATPEKLDKYYKNRNTILPYQWGVFVTSWARNKLCNIAAKIGNDVLYMDTDSIKFVGDYDHLFHADNLKIHDENLQAAGHFGLNSELWAPMDIKGNRHELGLWDFEHEYKSFKVLGAKRYCYTLPGDADIYPVVAGCPTQALKDWLKLHGCNALLRPFQLNIFLDSSESGKNSVTYHDNYDIDLPVTDYTGVTKIEHIGFGVCVCPTTFDMSMSDDYLKFLLGYAVSDKKALVRKGVLQE